MAFWVLMPFGNSGKKREKKYVQFILILYLEHKTKVTVFDFTSLIEMNIILVSGVRLIWTMVPELRQKVELWEWIEKPRFIVFRYAMFWTLWRYGSTFKSRFVLSDDCCRRRRRSLYCCCFFCSVAVSTATTTLDDYNFRRLMINRLAPDTFCSTKKLCGITIYSCFCQFEFFATNGKNISMSAAYCS